MKLLLDVLANPHALHASHIAWAGTKGQAVQNVSGFVLFSQGSRCRTGVGNRQRQENKKDSAKMVLGLMLRIDHKPAAWVYSLSSELSSTPVGKIIQLFRVYSRFIGVINAVKLAPQSFLLGFFPTFGFEGLLVSASERLGIRAEFAIDAITASGRLH